MRAYARQNDTYVPVPSAFSTFNIGDSEVSIIQDGTAVFDASFFGVNADPEDVYALMAANNLSNTVSATLNVILVKTGDRTILLDTGLGLMSLDGTSPPNAGRLTPTLALLGVTPEAITDVVISHLHPDHIGGISDGVTPAYPNAAYYFPQGDYDFMQSGPVGNEQVDGLIGLANSLLAPIQASDQLTVYASDAETEIVPGIFTAPTPGHTPGHVALRAASGDTSFVYTGDAVTNSIISLQHPEYFMGFDAIPEVAVASRRALLDMLASDATQTFGYHFAFPGVGFVAADGDAFRFTSSL